MLEPLYGETTELTRFEIIDKTLREMGMPVPPEESALSKNEAAHLSIVIVGLRCRLPEGNINTGGAFKHVNAGCCAPCHTSRPYTDMNLIELSDGSQAWV